MVVAVFYCLGALYGERRDRSVLFWKSLPVSDLTTVLSKAFLPLAVMPVVLCAIVLAAHLVMLAWSAMVVAAHGIPLATWTDHLPFPFMWPAFARGMIIMSLWYAPVVGWLLLVSGWARRVPILWAILPWLGLLVVDALAFNSKLVLPFLGRRLAGGFVEAFTAGARGDKPVHAFADLDPTPVLANPELWLGLVIAAACIAAAVRLRRYRDPI
jgi:ABC-2 type transport system permease protein